MFRVRDVKSVLTSRYEDLFSIQVNLKGVQIYILYKFVLKIRHSRICCFNDIRMGVAWVGILPRQGTGGSVPQKLSTWGGGVTVFDVLIVVITLIW